MTLLSGDPVEITSHRLTEVFARGEVIGTGRAARAALIRDLLHARLGHATRLIVKALHGRSTRAALTSLRIFFKPILTRQLACHRGLGADRRPFTSARLTPITVHVLTAQLLALIAHEIGHGRADQNAIAHLTPIALDTHAL